MILLTGGAGYIGTHTALYLRSKGVSSAALDNLERGNREMVMSDAFIHGDLRLPWTLDEAFSRYPIEGVIHFAAYAYVGESVEHPARYFQNNVAGTLNLLEAMRRHGVRDIVFSSSCATYGQPESQPITEDMPQQPVNPYGFTKLSCERMMEAYADAYGLRFAALRYFNAAGADLEARIGEKHFPETHLIPRILDVAAGKASVAEIYGSDYPTPDGSCVRDYVHVTDLARAHYKALLHLQSGEGNLKLNLGTARGFSNLEVADAVRRVTGRDVPVIMKPRRPGDPAVLTGSYALAKKTLGWEPELSTMETIVGSAWRWHQKMHSC